MRICAVLVEVDMSVFKPNAFAVILQAWGFSWNWEALWERSLRLPGWFLLLNIWNYNYYFWIIITHQLENEVFIVTLVFNTKHSTVSKAIE